MPAGDCDVKTQKHGALRHGQRGEWNTVNVSG